MKKHISILFVLIFLLSASGCGVKNNMEASATASPEKITQMKPSITLPIKAPKDIKEGTPIAFDYKRIRTNGFHNGIEYPKAFVIKNRSQLDSYYIDACGLYNMDSFLKETSSYSDEWFASHVLIVALLQESSGSIGHEVSDVTVTEENIYININRTVPEAGTADMAQYHILIEICADDYNGQTPLVGGLNKKGSIK